MRLPRPQGVRGWRPRTLPRLARRHELRDGLTVVVPHRQVREHWASGWAGDSGAADRLTAARYIDDLTASWVPRYPGSASAASGGQPSWADPTLLPLHGELRLCALLGELQVLWKTPLALRDMTPQLFATLVKEQRRRCWAELREFLWMNGLRLPASSRAPRERRAGGRNLCGGGGERVALGGPFLVGVGNG